MKIKPKYYYLLLIIGGILLLIILLIYFSKRDYNWSDKRKYIDGTLKTKPEYGRTGKGSSSSIDFEINEMPIVFKSCSQFAEDHTSMCMTTELNIGDKVNIEVLEYDFKNDIDLDSTKFHFQNQRLTYYGILSSNGRQYVDRNMQIEPPNFLKQLILSIIICLTLIIIGFIKFIDEL